MSQKTYMPAVGPGEKRWVIFDGKDKRLGRLATRVARVLRGKHRSDFTPHLDCGDGVIVINAREIALSGNKGDEDVPVSHSGFIGGLKEKNLAEYLENNPEKVLTAAVKGMLPKNRLRDKMLKHLRVYGDDEHPHQAQQPVEYDWENDTVK